MAEGGKGFLWIIKRIDLCKRKTFGLWQWEFLADSRLRGVEMGSGGQKRVALDGNKERFLQKKNFWFLKMDGFWNKQGTAFAKESFLYVKRRFLRTVKSGSNKRCFGYENERLLRAKHKTFCKWKTFGWRKRQTFSAHAKPTDKEKLFSAHNDIDFALHQS